MQRRVALLIALGSWLLCAMPAAGSPLTGEKSERIVEHVAKFLETVASGSRGVGISLSITAAGELVMAKGFGEATQGQPATAETLYHIGSITKQFTAAALLAQLEKGAIVRRTGRPLALDTEIKEIFPGVDHWSADPQQPVTVRRLLNMNSNLPNFTRRPPPGTDPWGTIPASQLMERLKSLAQWGWPDSFEYSNTSYFLVSEIIEAVEIPGGRMPASERDAVRSLVLDQAGLSATGFTSDARPSLTLAAPNYKRKPAFTQGDWLKGSGDMVSNVIDLARWNTALMAGQVISEPSRALMFTDGARIGPTDWYGMGWFIAHEPQRTFYYHSGTVPGYTGFNAIVVPDKGPEWVSVSLLLNAENVSEIDQLARSIADIVLLE